MAHIGAGGTYVAEYPGELTHHDNAPFKLRGKQVYINGRLCIGPHHAVGYLMAPYGARESAVSLFACATMSVRDAVSLLLLSKDEIIARAERGELGGIKIQIPGEPEGEWFLSRRDVMRKAAGDRDGILQRFGLRYTQPQGAA
jgi:hypothetical protein